MDSGKAYSLFCVGAVVLVLLPVLFTHGMFLDGITYSSISRNLSEGNGSLWHLSYTQTLYPEFFEHPPLVFWLQSTFFKIFGSGFWVERLYSILISVLILVLASKLVKMITDRKSTSLPLLALMSPLFVWVAYHNMLESTMMLFCFSSCLYLLKASIRSSISSSHFLAALFVALAVFSKGLVALFVLSLPCFLFLLKTIDVKQMFIQLAGLTMGLAFLGAVVYSTDGGRNYFELYFFNQISASIQGNRGSVSSLSFLWDSGVQMLIPVIVTGIILIVLGGKIKLSKKIVLPLSLAACSYLPLFISPRLFRHYSYPCVLFIIVACAAQLDIHYNHSAVRLKGISTNQLRKLGLTMIAVGLLLCLTFNGKYLRDKSMISSILDIELPEGTLVCCDSELASDWLSLAYLQRYRKMSIQSSGCQGETSIKKSKEKELIIEK